ncbi:MAG: Gfo/Idh/MocA family oxidoreductase [Lacibacter sp.]
MQPINTAICSFGMSGWVFHAPFISTHPGFRFYAVWERSKNLAQEKYPDVKVYRTLDEMLADQSVELVVVNTPNATHYDYTKKALLAGKHVICEKPFTVTVVQAEELIQLAAKQNKQLSVFQNRRYDSDYRTIKKVLEEKLLGDVVEAEFHFDRYKEELSPKLHKETPAPGTGSLYDLGSHLIDQTLQLFGMPQAVFADIAAMRPISQVDDYFELLLYYPSSRVRIKASYQVREALPGYVIHGSKGTFIKPKTDMQEAQLQAGMLPTADGYGTEPESEKGLLHTEINGKVIKEYIPSLKGNYTDYYEGIYQAIRNNQPLPVTAEDGMKVIKIIEAAFQSSKERRVIDL